MSYYKDIVHTPKLKCTNCDKEIEGTILMVQGRPYCSKICILKEKWCSKCNTPMRANETICSSCGAHIRLRKKGSE